MHEPSGKQISAQPAHQAPHFRRALRADANQEFSEKKGKK